LLHDSTPLLSEVVGTLDFFISSDYKRVIITSKLLIAGLQDEKNENIVLKDYQSSSWGKTDYLKLSTSESNNLPSCSR
jgi:hypothetical protein